MEAARAGTNTGDLQAALPRELRLRFPEHDPDIPRFLAAGEYTFNYRVRLGGREAVLRLVTGSQMGLGPAEQVEYEAHALELLHRSGRTPGLIAVEPRPAELPYPYLVIDYLPGRPLDYNTGLAAAARCAAAIHRLGVPDRHRLQDHRDPLGPTLREVDQLLSGPPLRCAAAAGRHGAVIEFGARVRAGLEPAGSSPAVDLTIINTDLNTHNFIVNDGRAWLIDWEKARIGPSTLDLAHFLLPTTTLWRDQTATRLTTEQQATFLDAYLAERPELDRTPYLRAVRTSMRLAALRAVAWCAWALAAGQSGDRAIQHEETLAKCRMFTAPGFLEELARELGL
jgi:aminoglycoside phosphotransferase (APT) family kinase protein